ncbi:tetratricopeptide repeat protein [Allomeiothermus silvanus]|uniref:tetratricopeptide repeat protein n=1 Tax=Allomeiothermus silvanus TaxID=52022 RepID=UPI0023F1C675|nr:tetratricopeptide repeat protein [Allomeiothermus silvanus]
MESEARRYLKQQFNLEGAISPGRFESELAKRIGSPARRKPVLQAWKGYLGGGGLEAVRRFYSELLAHPRERLEGLVYAMHLPYLEFYLQELPALLPERGKVLEIGAFTGLLLKFLVQKRPDLEWHALEGVEEAVAVGKTRTPGIEWHQGWYGEPLDGVPLVDVALMLSVLPEGYLGNLPARLDTEEFYRHFEIPQRLAALSGLLRPGGLLVYGHGPFLGKNFEAVGEALIRLGFSDVRRVGEGEYVLVLGRMPEELRLEAPVKAQEAKAPPAVPVLAETQAAVSVDEAWALLEGGDYATVLARIPASAGGRLSYLRGRALMALSRFEEAEQALERAACEEAEDLRVLCWAEMGEYQRALTRLEALSSRGGRYRLALGRVYLGLGRLSEALRQLYESGLPESRLPIKLALERLEERAFRFGREGDWSEVSRRVEFVEDLSPELLTRGLLFLGLQATLQQGLWARAERYARRLYDQGEVAGALGLALTQLRVRGPEGLEDVPLVELKAVEPYLTDAVARAEDATALLALGLLRFREGRYSEALRHLERAAREGRGESAGLAYHYLALTKRTLGYPMLEVLGEHKRAHAHKAYPVPVLYQMAQEALAAGEPVLAREFLGRVRDAGLEAVQDQLEGLLALVEKLEGPWEAFRLLTAALARTPQPSLEQLALAYRLSRSFRHSEEAEKVRGEYLAALYAQGRLEEAGELLEDELAHRPDAIEVMFDLAEHFERSGTYKKAAEVWRKALEVAYYAEKDLALAREILRNLLFLNPTDPELALYLEELKATSAALAQLDGSADTFEGLTPQGLLHEGLPKFHGEYLIVVGGHTQLRSRMVPFLEAQGLRLDWFDADANSSGREAIRRIQNRVERAHGLMIISSYVGHDVSEPVRLEAENRGVPVYITPGRARGITGFLRAVADFAPQIFKRALKSSS